MLLLSKIAWAHEVNEAFFKFSLKENSVEVQAEFPWTMRNALIQFNPRLQKAANKQDFEDTFVEYIKKNLVLKDKNGKILPFLDFSEQRDLGHSHQNNYLIRFEGNNPFEVSNTMMFNLYANQINHSTVSINSEEKSFKTKYASPTFTLGEKKSYPYFYFLILLVPILIFVLRAAYLK